MTRCVGALAALALVLGASATAAGPSDPPQGYQRDSAFADSYAAHGVSNASATTQKTSCYKPEVFYDGTLPATSGYPGGGTTTCPPAVPTTGENTGPYDTQDLAGRSNPTALVKDHSESDIRAIRTIPTI